MQRLPLHFELVLYFLVGVLSCSLVLVSVAYLAFALRFQNQIYPGVTIAGQDFGGQTKSQAEDFFQNKTRANFDTLQIEITNPLATVSATGKELALHLDGQLMANRAFSVGRQTKNPYYNFLQIFSAWQGQINLPREISLDTEVLNKKLDTIAPLIEKPAVDAVYKFVPNTGPDLRGRVTAFSPSLPGRSIERDRLIELIKDRLQTTPPPTLSLALPTRVVQPAIRSSTADELGIKNLLGTGYSYFYDSIPGRVHNIGLGTEKVSGRLVAPNEVFSFSESIGTVSAVFGFQKAYAIIKGKTVLDDGGGVCQVSTTLYRAVLNSGLPVVERVGHSYRVGFYEQGGFLPGMDATVYPPSPDFKFRNDTGNWLLIQATFDKPSSRLTFEIFGTNDGRQTQIQGPVILSTSAPPEAIYEDDPNLQTGIVRQVDTAHAGAKVYFKRKVTRNDQTLIDETVTTDYVPWPARFIRGTKT